MPGARILLVEDDEVLRDPVKCNLQVCQAEFHPLAYLPKPFPVEAFLHLAAEAAQCRNAGYQNGNEDTAFHGGKE